MKIISLSRTSYALHHEDGRLAGSLIYLDDSLTGATLTCDKEYNISKESMGKWVTTGSGTGILHAMCKVRIGGTISLIIANTHYTFRKPFSWKLRFTLLNTEKEELLAILPSANWKVHSYNFILQLNGEFVKETDSFVILQALHCAVCSMAMMNGFIPPAVVSSF